MHDSGNVLIPVPQAYSKRLIPILIPWLLLLWKPDWNFWFRFQLQPKVEWFLNRFRNRNHASLVPTLTPLFLERLGLLVSWGCITMWRTSSSMYCTQSIWMEEYSNLASSGWKKIFSYFQKEIFFNGTSIWCKESVSLRMISKGPIAYRLPSRYFLKELMEKGKSPHMAWL